MKLKNITVQLGGVHDHWLRNGSDNPTLLMAAMQYYHYDFICLLDNEFGEKAIKEKQDIERWMPGKRVYLGSEKAYDWGHVVCIENTCEDYDLANLDWRTELQKLHRGGGVVVLAHVGYPYTSTAFFDAAKLNEVIDGDYTDAIQLERDSDWELVRERAMTGAPLPLAGGWDAHYLLPVYDDKPNLYSSDCIPYKHFEARPGMRTIVFSEDNSLESIRKSIRAGKSVLENVETGNFYGSPELIELLIEEGYPEKIKELTHTQNKLVLQNTPLKAYAPAVLQFPGKGIVTIPADNSLSCSEVETDELGCLSLDLVPMPVMQNFTYLPFYWRGEGAERMWAVKVNNNISYKVVPKIKEGKRMLTIEAMEDIDGDIFVKEPVTFRSHVNVGKGEELLCVKIPDEIPDIFNIALEIRSLNGGYSTYEKTTGIAIARNADWEWSDCPGYYANTQEQCGGFGSNRPYPGEDVFSGVGQFRWDQEYLYFRCDIVDSTHVAPNPGRDMYRSDCTCISFDPKLTRGKNMKEIVGFMIGFTKEGPQVWQDRNIENAKLDLEDTAVGRIVTAAIPWESIGAKPEKGLHIGMHFSFLNDNGDGLLDNVHWPMPAEDKRMELPGDFGVLYLE